MDTRIYRADATGAITTGAAFLSSAVLTAGAGAAASLVLREVDGSGRIILTLKALTGTSVAWQAEGQVVLQGLHATLTGAGAEYSACY